MNELEILKALANDTRWLILQWLKAPKKHFPKAQSDAEKEGVCCGLIHEKSGLSQSTVSHYLSILQRAELITATRQGQWTYYKRNEPIIQQFIKRIEQQI